MKVFPNVSELKASIGLGVGESDWFVVTQDQVDHFASITRDEQFIHINPEQAQLTSFGGTIAHGFLSLSMLSYFAQSGCGVSVEGAKVFINYGFDKVRFLNPVRVGSKIRAHSKLLSVEEKCLGQVLTTLQISVEIEGMKKPALFADWLLLIDCN